MNNPTVLQTDFPLPLFGRGKVRDTYDLGDKLLIVATDRISAFDSVLPTGIPRKGDVLTALSAFWFGPIYRDVAVYVLFVLMLWVRPQGLLGTA